MKGKPERADPAGARYLALQRRARAQGRPTAELLQRDVLEAFLRRLSRSRHADRLVLKGGMLMAAFDLRRATRDVDLLAQQVDNDPAAVGRLVTEIVTIEVEDGVVFLPDTLTLGAIRDEDVYPGVRVGMEARLVSARVRLSVDVSVGDPVVPAAARTFIPFLFGEDGVALWAYPKAMVVAEKLVTALQRGIASTRWRDFADLYLLVHGDLDRGEVIEALRAVAAHRGVHLRPLGEVLRGMSGVAQGRWATWRDRQGAHDRVPADFNAVLQAIDHATRPWLNGEGP